MSMASDFTKSTNGWTMQRMTFINVDERGHYVYRFEWTMGARSGSHTLAVSKQGSTWHFTPPNYHAEARQAQDPSPSAALQASSLAASQDPNRLGVLGLNPFGAPLPQGNSIGQGVYDAYARGFEILNRWIEEGRISSEDGIEKQGLLERLMLKEADIGDIERVTNFLPGEVGSFDNGGGAFGDITVGGGGGGGGRGGAIGPVYRAPDRRTIEDQVTGQVANLLGAVDEDFVQEFTNLFMTEDRRNFDSKDKQIDPGTSVVEAIRNTAEYKRIHKLRPDSVDERTWISRRRSLGESGGLAESELEQFGIDQATIGGRVSETAEAGAVKQFVNTNQAPRILQTKFKQAAADMFSGVVK